MVHLDSPHLSPGFAAKYLLVEVTLGLPFLLCEMQIQLSSHIPWSPEESVRCHL